MRVTQSRSRHQPEAWPPEACCKGRVLHRAASVLCEQYPRQGWLHIALCQALGKCALPCSLFSKPLPGSQGLSLQESVHSSLAAAGGKCRSCRCWPGDLLFAPNW